MATQHRGDKVPETLPTLPQTLGLCACRYCVFVDVMRFEGAGKLPN